MLTFDRYFVEATERKGIQNLCPFRVQLANLVKQHKRPAKREKKVFCLLCFTLFKPDVHSECLHRGSVRTLHLLVQSVKHFWLIWPLFLERTTFDNQSRCQEERRSIVWNISIDWSIEFKKSIDGNNSIDITLICSCFHLFNHWSINACSLIIWSMILRKNNGQPWNHVIQSKSGWLWH